MRSSTCSTRVSTAMLRIAARDTLQQPSAAALQAPAAAGFIQPAQIRAVAQLGRGCCEHASRWRAHSQVVAQRRVRAPHRRAQARGCARASRTASSPVVPATGREHHASGSARPTRSRCASSSAAKQSQSGRPSPARAAARARLVRGQFVGLLVVPCLQAVLDAAQEAVDRGKLRHRVRGEQLLPRQHAAAPRSRPASAAAGRCRRVSAGRPAR